MEPNFHSRTHLEAEVEQKMRFYIKIFGLKTFGLETALLCFESLIFRLLAKTLAKFLISDSDRHFCISKSVFKRVVLFKVDFDHFAILNTPNVEKSADQHTKR